MAILQTERMWLRQMTDADEDNLMHIFGDPVAMKYYTSTKNREEAKRWIQWNLTNYQKHGAGLWICERKEDGAFLGQCGIVPQLVDGVPEMEIGYLFSRQYWGNGYATEVASAVKEYGFKELTLPKLISMIYKPNTPSIKVAERIGMTLEKETFIKGRETYIYSIFA